MHTLCADEVTSDISGDSIGAVDSTSMTVGRRAPITDTIAVCCSSMIVIGLTALADECRDMVDAIDGFSSSTCTLLHMGESSNGASSTKVTALLSDGGWSLSETRSPVVCLRTTCSRAGDPPFGTVIVFALSSSWVDSALLLSLSYT